MTKVILLHATSTFITPNHIDDDYLQYWCNEWDRKSPEKRLHDLLDGFYADCREDYGSGARDLYADAKITMKDSNGNSYPIEEVCAMTSSELILRNIIVDDV